MNLFNIKRALQMKVERKWSTLYVAVDAHGTMVRPYHDRIEFYPGAVEVLQWFTQRPDFKLILWTSSYIDEIVKICELAEKSGVYFDLVNGNTFEKNSKLACFDKKFYFNILLDDKAGFEPETDWASIQNTLIEVGLWCKNFSDHTHAWRTDGAHSNEFCSLCFTSRPKWDTWQKDYEK